MGGGSQDDIIQRSGCRFWLIWGIGCNAHGGGGVIRTYIATPIAPRIDAVQGCEGAGVDRSAIGCRAAWSVSVFRVLQTTSVVSADNSQLFFSWERRTCSSHNLFEPQLVRALQYTHTAIASPTGRNQSCSTLWVARTRAILLNGVYNRSEPQG